jgi:SAM-dependent methyltransferase
MAEAVSDQQRVAGIFSVALENYQAGRFPIAEALFRSILRPDFVEAQLSLGNALAAQGKYDEAIGCYEQALRIKPDYQGALDNIRVARDMKTKASESGYDPREPIGRTLTGDVLEVGPGFAPFGTGPGARVKFADRSVEGGRDQNWPEIASLPHGPQAEYDVNIDVDGLAAIADRSFDVVIACHMIEHLANPIAALLEFDRVLRTGGRIVIVMPDRHLTFDAVRTPTPLDRLMKKFEAKVTDLEDWEIEEFCGAIYYQPPVHPPAIREWHNPNHLDAERLALHRRRSIHVHCWSPEEYAAMIAGIVAKGLAKWKLHQVYFAVPRRFNEFGLVLERIESSLPPRSLSANLVADWVRGARNAPGNDPKRVAKLDGALRRDIRDRADLAALLSAVAEAAA